MYALNTYCNTMNLRGKACARLAAASCVYSYGRVASFSFISVINNQTK